MHSVVQRLALLGSIVLLNACTTLGPDYARPDVAWLDDWNPDLYGQRGDGADPDESDLRFWWQLFDDPVLNQLIDTARQENPTLRLAGLRILESRALLGIAGSSLYPQVQQLSGSAAYVDTRDSGGAGGSSGTSFGSYQLGFGLGWELDFWGRFRRGIESADSAFFASLANQQAAQVLLSAQVADLYFGYLTLQRRIATAEENAAIQRRSYEITERIYREGQQAELNLQQALTQYLSTLATIPALKLSLVKTRNALAVLLGRPPGTLPELAGAGSGALPDVGKIFVHALPAKLLERRPDVRAALWQIAAQSAQIGLAEAEFYPSISLNGNLEWSGNTLGASPDVSTLAAGPAFRWNLFDYGRIANNVRVQDARLQQLIEQYRNVLLQAAREIDDAAITLVRTQEQQDLLVDAVVSAKRALTLANVRFQEGYSDFQRVLDAQRVYFSQTDREQANRGALIASVIALYKALGGGWLETDMDGVVPADVRDTMRERSDWGELLEQPLPPSDIDPSSYYETDAND